MVARRRISAAVRPNAGIEAAYRRKLKALIAEMARSFDYWVKASWRASEPVMAQDATPAEELRVALNRLGRRWQRRFNEAAPELAAYFAKQAHRRSDAALASILRRAGFTVRFTMTPEMRDVFRAVVAENVQLIRSIPQQYFTQVQGDVMRSVAAGRDLNTLSRDLAKRHGVTARRAAFIALDQNNKATAQLQRARQTSLGIEEGVWLHSH